MPPPSLLALLLCLTSVTSGADLAAELARFGDRLETLEATVADMTAFQKSQAEQLRVMALLALGSRQTAQLGGTCSADFDCRLTEKAVCQSGVCACPDGHWNFHNSTCRPAVAEGELCSLLGDCAATRADLTCSGRPRRCAERVCGSSSSGGYRYRLVGGASCSEGRVQAVGPDWAGDDADWWQVCADYWSSRDAAVVCRSLQLSGGEVVPAEAARRRQRVWKVSLDCGGQERGLQVCVRPGRLRIGISDCRRDSVAAVRCTPPEVE